MVSYVILCWFCALLCCLYSRQVGVIQGASALWRHGTGSSSTDQQMTCSTRPYRMPTLSYPTMCALMSLAGRPYCGIIRHAPKVHRARSIESQHETTRETQVFKKCLSHTATISVFTLSVCISVSSPCVPASLACSLHALAASGKRHIPR